MLAGLLDEAGISMGDKFLPPDENNPTGYWEDEDFLWINRGLLEHCRGSWKEPPSRKDVRDGMIKFDNITNITISRKERKHGKKLWGWKDPRSCLTIHAMEYLLNTPRYIILDRNDNAIISSLLISHGGSDVAWKKLLSIYRHRINSFIMNEGPKFVRFTYESFVNKETQEKTLTDLAGFIDIEPTDLLRCSGFIKTKNDLA